MSINETLTDAVYFPTRESEQNDIEAQLHDIAQQIAELRKSVDIIRDSTKPLVQASRKIGGEANDLTERYKKEMFDLQSRKANVDKQIAEIEALLANKLLALDELAALQAKLRKLLDERARLADALKTLQEIFENNEKWPQVADFQKQDILEAVRAFKDGKNGFAIFNDMGLGKTLEAFYILRAIWVEFERIHGREPTAGWFTKKSLVMETIKEGRVWVPEILALPLKGSEPREQRESMFELLQMTGGMVVTNYETANTMESVRNANFDIVIIDECHKLKGGANPGGPTKIFLNTKKVVRDSKFVLMLSGTPMVNAWEEMWSYLHIFDPKKFDDLRAFKRQFEKISMFSNDVQIDSDKLLKQALMGQCVRRRSDEVGIELPEFLPKRYDLDMVNMQAEAYALMRECYFAYLNKDKTALMSAKAVIAQITRLRQIALYPAGIMVDTAEGKLDDDGIYSVEAIKMAMDCPDAVKVDEAMDLIETLHQSGEQAVIFASFNAVLFEIQRRCAEKGITCEVITSQQKRDLSELAEEFRQGTLKVLAINLMMGEGLNLHKDRDKWPGGASHVIRLDRWWNNSKNDQAKKRIHRMGVKDACTVHDFFCNDSVDLFIEALYTAKDAQFANVLEREELRPAAEWLEMLKGLI